MKVYIAGKMRGIKNFNTDAFYSAEAYLTGLGFEAVNPVKFDVDRGISLISETGNTDDLDNFNAEDLKEIIREDVEAVMSCDAVYMLDSWKDSKGAKAEKAIGEWLGLTIIYQGDNESWRV